MTEYLNKSFSVGMAGDQQYRDNWEATFGKKAKEPEPPEGPEPDTCDKFMTCGCGWYTDGGCICYTRR